MIPNRHVFLFHQVSLEAYIRAVNTSPILTEYEEQALAKRLHYLGDIEAAKPLILSHLRFVVNIARNYYHYSFPQADLIQEGNFGLIKAVRRFNPAVGVRLVSFAVHWIKAEIHEYVLRNWRIVNIATTKAQRKLFFNIRKTKQRLSGFHQDEDEDEDEVAKELGVTNKDVRDMEYRISVKDMTFDQVFYDESLGGQEKYSSFTDCFSEYYLNDHTAYTLSFIISRLDQRSQHIIRARWLYSDYNSSLQELAYLYGISAERVRQIESHAMKKMRILLSL